MHELGLIGGTFDRFHIGHKKLITTALKKCQRLEIWILSDSIAKSKNFNINNWDTRKNEIIDNLDSNLIDRIEFGILNDDYGPAPSHPKATAIICSEETLEICIKINKIRKNKLLNALDIIEVGHALAWDKRPVSSTRIRNGEIDRNGDHWKIKLKSDDTISYWNDELLKMTKEVEYLLKEPFGELFEGPEDNPEIAMNKIIKKYGNFESQLIAVGDVSVLTLEKLNRPPDIAIIDGKTKRIKWIDSELIKHKNYDRVVYCINQPGEITKSLFNQCRESIKYYIEEEKTSLIIIDGEEDLAPLLIHLLAPLNTIVLYGQPDRGVVVRITTEDVKKSCKQILEKFEIK